MVRCALGKDEDVAVMTSEGLSAELEMVWSADTVRPISVEHVVARLRPKQWNLLNCMEDYLAIRSIQERPTRLAVDALIHVAGNRPMQKYSREDARRLVRIPSGQAVENRMLSPVRKNLSSILPTSNSKACQSAL